MAGNRIPGPVVYEKIDAGTLALTTHRPPDSTGMAPVQTAARSPAPAGARPPSAATAATRVAKSVLLSFDDGPEPVKDLESILATLEKNQIRAEFYLLGSEVVRNPAATALIVQKGHTVQNHSWDHPRLDKLTAEAVSKQLADTQEAIAAATGKTPTKVRPPYGAGGWPKDIDADLALAAKKLSLQIHNWDVDTEDWKAPAGLGIVKLAAIKRQLDALGARTRIDILMHVQPGTARDLPDFIAKLSAWGYSFAAP